MTQNELNRAVAAATGIEVDEGALSDANDDIDTSFIWRLNERATETESGLHQRGTPAGRSDWSQHGIVDDVHHLDRDLSRPVDSRGRHPHNTAFKSRPSPAAWTTPLTAAARCVHCSILITTGDNS